MATDPTEHPAHKVPEKFPLPPGDLPPSTEPPTLPPQPRLHDGVSGYSFESHSTGDLICIKLCDRPLCSSDRSVTMQAR
jgi:hypothetical protein